MTLFDASHYHSLAEPLQRRAQEQPDTPALVLLHSGRPAQTLTAAGLDMTARRVAARLLRAGVQVGELVAVGLPHGEELVAAFWGIVYAGAVPSIFAYPGPLMHREIYTRRLTEFAADSHARAVITAPETAAEMRAVDSGTRLVFAPPFEGEKGLPADWSGTPCPDREAPACIQFTSGTTGRRKGVILSHRAVLEFVDALQQVVRAGNGDVMISWMPFSHDFGLFAGLVYPISVGHPTVLISPHHWLRRPMILLEAIRDYAGTICLSTNSALQHMVRYVNEEGLAGLDIRSLRIMFIGAEPTLLSTLEAFLSAFQAAGLKQRMLVPAYGMAENTLAVSIFNPEQDVLADWVDSRALCDRAQAMPAQPGDPGAIAYVNCGRATPGTRITIRDDAGNGLPDRSVGEIFFTSTAMYSGYQNRPGTNPGAAGWHGTGDLGYLVGENLFICGRKSDLIIVGGRNIHPEDIEAVAGRVDGMDPANTVAFGVMDEQLGTESIVLVGGFKRLPAKSDRFVIEKTLRQRIYEAFEVTLGDVRFVPRQWIERTTNGKLSRRRNREKYLRELGRSPAPSQLSLPQEDNWQS